jgi:hypothetical protein
MANAVILPCLLVVLGVRQHVPDKNLLRSEADPRDQSVLNAFDVENRTIANLIGLRPRLPNIVQVPPGSLLGYSVPRVQRSSQIAVLLRRFQQFLAADDPHSGPFSSRSAASQFANSIRFAIRELVKQLQR